MKKIHLGLIGITTLFLTACTVGVSSNKTSIIRDTDSINNLTVKFNFNGGTYASQEQVEFKDVKPTSYWKYVKARLDEDKITPPDHTTFEGFSFAKDDHTIISDSYVVKDNITVYAQYNPKPGEYCTVNWKDGETSEIIKTETYFEGQKPELKDIPYHDGKTFDHWEPEITPIEHGELGGSREHKAVYVPIKTIYNVILDYYGDGSEKHTQKVLNGECAVEPKITKEGYKLTKWEYVSGGTGEFNFDTKITGNIEIKAIWVQCFTITWKNYDGTIIKEDKIEEGKSPIKPSNPRRYSTNPFIDYTFKEWSPAVIEEVHSNQTYIATYQTVLYNDTKTCMHITTVENNKDFEFTYTATSSITIDWGDGTPRETQLAGTIVHTYENTGEFNIRIFDSITSISVSSITPPPDSALIEELYLGKDVTSIGMGAFYGCSKLQTVTFEEGSKLTSIGMYAFKGCSSLTGITIPGGVTSIGEDAFYDCSSLTGITIPSGVTSIGNYAFYKCSSLTGITIPSGVTSIGANAFRYCSQLQTVSFVGESKLTSIGDYAFHKCSSLTGITIPSGVTSIGEYAFCGCSSLTGITIPSGVTSIGESAFDSCSQLQTVSFVGESKLTSIGNYAFYKCSSLTGITIPSGVTSIGANAFENCSSLTGITIPSGVTSIGESAFDSCSQLQTVSFVGESKLTSIGDYAFYKCSSLTGITIPGGVTSIGEDAFYDCSSLTGITIPSGVTSIGANAFRYCSQLQTVSFVGESKLESISYSAFENCSSLTGITIPSGVTSIGEYAFASCSQLQIVDLTALNAVPTLEGDYVFWRCHSSLKLYVKVDMVDDFKTADGWKEYKDKITDDPVPSTNV